ncbi:MAG: sigma-70 family RNA polymerase sigma factor [Gemmatimonadota bacterium]
MNPLDDSGLVARAQGGDRQAFGELVTRYGVLVNGLCRGMAGSTWDAQDLAHDAFVEAWLRLSSLRDPARFAPWLRTLTLNLCRMWHRERKREREGLAEVEAGAREPAAEGDLLGRLSDGLARLSSDHRLALALHYGEGLSYEQIAAFLEVPVGTVMSRLHRARAGLKERMGEMPDPNDPRPDGADALRRTVDAEIEVLMRLWEEEARQEGVDSRYRSPACQRLSILLGSAPDRVRAVLEAMDPALSQHVAIRVRRAGPAAIEVVAACAFEPDPGLRARARQVLRRVLAWAPDQAHGEPYFTLPLRLAATLLLDSVLRSGHPAAAKAALLAELLPGCEDDASTILVGGALLCFPEEAFPLLWRQWWKAGGAAAGAADAAGGAATADGAVAAEAAGAAVAPGTAAPGVASATLAALARCGSRFLASLGAELADGHPQRWPQALAGVQAVARLVDLRVLSRGRETDPSLETRTGGGLRTEEIDPLVRAAVCRHLAALVQTDDASVRDAAVTALGLLGQPEDAPALRACLGHAEVSTQVAAIYGLKDLGDAACAAELVRLARQGGTPARRAALQALGQLRVAAAAPVAVELVSDPEVRPQAITALGEIGGAEARAVLEGLIRSGDRQLVRLASSALYGGRRTERPASEATRERLRRVRGEGARPLLHVSVVGAIRNLPEVRPYPEPELTRLIGEVCGDYSTTRRELIMDGLMVRAGGVYELTESGRAVWRVERFIRDHYLVGPEARGSLSG